MEVLDGAFPLVRGIETSDDAATAFDGASQIFLVGSKPRTKGMERADLIRTNGPIFTAQGRAINDRAADDVRVVVVGNPCNTNWPDRHARGPRRASGALQRDDPPRREPRQGAERPAPRRGCGRDRAHGRLGQPLAHHVRRLPPRRGRRSRSDRAPGRRLAGGGRSSRRSPSAERPSSTRGGASSAASAASAAIDHMATWWRGTEGDAWTSMAVPSDGSYDVPAGLVSSFPVQIADGAWRIVHGIEHGVFARERIAASVDELQSERAAVARPAGLIPRGPGRSI